MERLYINITTAGLVFQNFCRVGQRSGTLKLYYLQF